MDEESDEELGETNEPVKCHVQCYSSSEVEDNTEEPKVKFWKSRGCARCL